MCSCILRKNMGHLEISGATVPTASQKDSGHGTGSLWILLKLFHHSNEHIYAYKLCMSIYVEISTVQRAFIHWHRVNDSIIGFLICTYPSVQ